jgi:starch phosphorylase
VRTILPPNLSGLESLARNLRWSWHAPTCALFSGLDPDAWERARGNPVTFLHSLSGSRLAAISGDAALLARIDGAVDDLNRYMTGPSWYEAEVPSGPAAIAYFSPEYGIAAAMPQYSGGLGILAGDHLKSASDLGVPIVAVGLLYGAGYFRQGLDATGRQTESYPHLDPAGMPLTLLRETDDSPAVVAIDVADGKVLHAQIWRADVGRVPLLLLDASTHLNPAEFRGLTERLYGGREDERLLQEILLGVGGVRALRVFSRLTGSPAPSVFHMNEGHAGFLGVERIRELVAEGWAFAEALEAVRGGTVFTTHTPVPAGIDRFPRAMIEQHFAAASWGIDREDIIALGAEPGGVLNPDVFNMAFMGLRLGGIANGVSVLHGAVSREMFGSLWEGFENREVPIGSITNGVHGPTWVDARLGSLAAERVATDEAWLGDAVSDGELWALKREMRESLVADARARLRGSGLQRAASAASLRWVDSALDPDILTIGFARRVPTYKRLTLMLRNPERLKALLLHPERPIQIVVAGKAHPHDEGGKSLIQQLVAFADDADVRHRIVFLPNYDIAMAERLYPGCDVWLNNPLRPLEACGTSGMKAALNGALNLSVLDGWWDEWHDESNGWAIPTADGVVDEARRDDIEAAALYDLIEREIAPLYYDRDGEGVPREWLARVRHTLATLGPKVQATRMVRDYTQKEYVPAASCAAALVADGGAPAKQLAAWKAMVRAAWPGVAVRHVWSEGLGAPVLIGREVTVRAEVALGGLATSDVSVQMLSGELDSRGEASDNEIAQMDHEGDSDGLARFVVRIRLEESGPWGYTVRVVPSHPLLTSVADLGLVAQA